jgi:hypothetical protein
VPKHKVIEDYYGTVVEVEPVLKSAGPFVYVERSWQEEDAAAPGSFVDAESFDRFTPEQARNLATQLNEAADEIDPAGVSTDAA